jgi:glycyl-tRNA synthetase
MADNKTKKNDPGNDTMEKLIALCKRCGIISPSSQIYGGINGCWDYGPVGVELKRNVKEDWWMVNVRLRDDIIGLDASIIMNPKVWQASGHAEGFNDLLVDCKECKQRHRVDHLDGDRCPSCSGELTEPKAFNLMFKTQLGAVETDATDVYLRPETCQSIFVNFKDMQTVSRRKVPFGIAQMGKSFRNEVTPRNFIFRSREFEQMEIEYFCHEDDAAKFHAEWCDRRLQWYLDLGVKPENLRRIEFGDGDLAHYARACTDIEYKFPFGWQELEGIADRGTYDLTHHSEAAGKDLSYFDDTRKEKYMPTVIEPSAGVDRTVLTLLCDAYDEEPERVVLRLSPIVAPVKAGIFPLVKKQGLPEIARDIHNRLRRKFVTVYDEGGSVGKRYRRLDEIGTPYCFTVDFDTLEDNTVTVRERDSMDQERIKIDEIESFLEKQCTRNESNND